MDLSQIERDWIREALDVVAGITAVLPSRRAEALERVQAQARQMETMSGSIALGATGPSGTTFRLQLPAG